MDFVQGFGDDETDYGLLDSYSCTDIENEEFRYEFFHKRMTMLNNVDYSLNSPLLPDEVGEFTRYLNGQPYQRRWSDKLWKKRRLAFSKRGPIHGVENFHKWVGKMNMDLRPSLRQIRKILAQTYKDSMSTFDVPAAFFKGWIKETVHNPKRETQCPEIERWGAMFLELHLVTLLLNACNMDEVKELKKIITFSEEPSTFEAGFHIITPSFGKIDICLGYIHFATYQRVLDRSMLLMMKDMYSARFHALCSMTQRVDNKYQVTDWRRLQDLYEAGDNMLYHSGSEAYAGIKMVEPTCNMKMVEIADKARPLIKPYTAFKTHVVEKIYELSPTLPGLMRLYKIIEQTESINLILAYYGAFRHWGHPFIQALEGLKKLHQQVTKHLKVDEKYAECLASDLAYKVLKTKFKETSRWYVDLTLLPSDHSLKAHITDGTWPTPKQILDFGDNWHKLPLIACFDVPDLIDPSQIYADKSHSMTRDEVIAFLESKRLGSIPTRKVLETMINSGATNWKKFLEEVDKYGIELKHLIIGLKAKERELKAQGRFFSLLSWVLREYFVVTEYLIKIHFLPLFKGLTMADDLTTLTKKMLDTSSGQGLSGYDKISYANHLDYEKWNNYQRIESNGPVFKVMGQFLGYPNLIYRTHEFFQKSIIYYNDRPDLMVVENGMIVNRTEERVVWNGQAGGLEGLRQKGWSVLNALSIAREGRDRNTKLALLAQGDNQIIFTNYKMQDYRDERELKCNLERIRINNDQIMKSIESGIIKLGLKINQDETMQSADFTNYGKIPIIRGNIYPLETKRWSRAACVTNDQLPSLGNVMSTVSSNALTIAYSSLSPKNTIVHLNWAGNFVRNLIDMHNPAMRRGIHHIRGFEDPQGRHGYIVKALYLDPCLGGVSGMSLNRFLIRMFPDPVSESLSFWKLIYQNSNSIYRNLYLSLGHPRLAEHSLKSFNKLLEDPLTLNLKNSISPISMMKEVIRSSLYDKAAHIPNRLIRDAVQYSKDHNEALTQFLYLINPLFPRFLSEFKSASYLGITEAIIGLFENSRTIRNVFRSKMSQKIDTIIVQSETQSLSHMHSTHWSTTPSTLWDCSSEHADTLRRVSWGRPVLGATIPHPIELLQWSTLNDSVCKICESSGVQRHHLITVVPKGMEDPLAERGPYPAYLGSRTSETTSIIHPWERETKIPLIDRACRLRNVIHWFVDPGTPLAQSIFSILEGLTGEDWTAGTMGFRRSGCGLHRFCCTRQSCGGYAAQSPAKLTRMVTTTDTMGEINEVNYDFMYQSLILFSQITVGECHEDNPTQGVYHLHFNCEDCIREIQNPTLSCDEVYIHPDVSETVSHWKPEASPWSIVRNKPVLELGDWELLPQREKSYHMGRIQGFIFGDTLVSNRALTEQTALFPLSLNGKLDPDSFMDGLLDGILRISGLNSLSRRSVMNLKKPRPTLLGTVLWIIEELSLDPAVVNLWRGKNFLQEFSRVPHKIPGSYPLSNYDLGSLGRSYLKLRFKQWCIMNDAYIPDPSTVWIFSDVNDTRLVGSLMISAPVTKFLYKRVIDSKSTNKLREFKGYLTSVRDPSLEQNLTGLPLEEKFYRVESELRHAAKNMVPEIREISSNLSDWSEEFICDCHVTEVVYTNRVHVHSSHTIPRIQDPTISGLRLFQCATGSHYKIRSIIKNMNISYHDVLCGGDGSGGIGSWLLRNNPNSRLIFNSLLNLEGICLKGASPSGPSAIELLPEISDRCVNLRDSWKHPNDLTQPSTWSYFRQLKTKHHLKIDLIVLDMEQAEDADNIQIIQNVASNILSILSSQGTLIYKTYLKQILSPSSRVLIEIGQFFSKVDLCWTDYSSSHTSEVYVVMQIPSDKNLKLIPDMRSLIEETSKFPAFRSPEDEFERALRVMRFKGMKGVPSRYTIDPFVESSTLFLILGVETGVAATLGEMVRNPAKLFNSTNTVYVIVMVALNSILKLTRGHITAVPIPSDSAVTSAGCLICGFLIWVSLMIEDKALHQWVMFSLSTAFPFSWDSYSEKELNYLRVSFRDLHIRTKNLHLNSQLSLVSQVIRMLFRLFPSSPVSPSPNAIDAFLDKFDLHLTVKEFKKSCDLFKLLHLPVFPMKLKLDQREGIIQENSTLCAFQD
ncbi:RNA-dependent RNA polymerase [Wuhan Insect virus 7]|uniref:RNA-dependent RNA polymerase n=1 Tax=Wuhan Insect virus 7 TaxID=1608112 RepID=UPI0005AD332F|nr:RNA-dependent RNA polymerase [Wuhan Insect virus 7]AJG39196.1 RNA-dependent RNA polymerase [Wuhan Insect virus 7]